MCGFIPSHSSTLLGAWNVTLGLEPQPSKWVGSFPPTHLHSWEHEMWLLGLNLGPRSVWVHSLPLIYTPGSMKCDSWAWTSAPGVCGFIPSHSSTRLGAWNVTLGLEPQPSKCVGSFPPTHLHSWEHEMWLLGLNLGPQSVWVHSLPLIYTPGSMKCDSWAWTSTPGVCGFIPSHSSTRMGAWNVTLGLEPRPPPLQAFTLVANPRLRSWHLGNFEFYFIDLCGDGLPIVALKSLLSCFKYYQGQKGNLPCNYQMQKRKTRKKLWKMMKWIDLIHLMKSHLWWRL
jgi:hypothetical protein